MRVSRLGLIIFPWLLSTAPASAQPYNDYGDESYDTVAPGESVASVDVFYDQLSPYGYWVDEPNLGSVFIPDQRGFVPYTVGHWQYTSVGFVWVSNEPFAWATSHYGRWAFSALFGRWVWLPDTRWGPAWVEWRVAGDDFGWAPLAPEIVVNIGYQPPIEAWHYCHSSRIFDVNVVRYYEPRERVITIHQQARPIEHYRTVSNARVVVGPPPTMLREHKIVVKPVKIDIKVAGRMTPVEAKAAVARAEQRKPVVLQQNKQRIEQNVTIRESARKAEAMPKRVPSQIEKPTGPQPPGRVEPGQPQPPARVEPKPPVKADPPGRVEPKPPAGRVEPKPEPKREMPARPEPKRAEPKPEPKREAPAPKREAPAPKQEPKREPAPKRDDKPDDKRDK